MRKHVQKAIKKLTPDSLFGKPNLTKWRIMLPIVLAIVGLVWLGLEYQVDQLVIASMAFVFAIISGAFAWVVGLITLVPIIGPLVIKILSIPIIWLINGIGYLISFIAIKRGYSQDVLTYRGLTITLIVGIVIGFVLGSIVT